MKPIEFPSVTLGIDMLSNETSLPKGAVRTATNIDLDKYGNFSRRTGYTAVASGSDYHSMWAAPQRQEMYGAYGAQLFRVRTFTSFTKDNIYVLRSADPVEWSEHNSSVFFSNRTTCGWIPTGSVVPRALGVPTPSTPNLVVSTTGGMGVGNYTVAISLVDDRGEESALSRYARTKLDAQGGILLTGLPVVSGYKMRVYITEPNGENMYLALEVPAGLSQYLVGQHAMIQRAPHAYLRPMPPGEFCRAYGARVYTAVGDTLNFSEPFRLGLNHPSRGYIQFGDPITFIEPLRGGIYVGAGSRVFFLAGDPSNATQRIVSTCRAAPHSSTIVPGEHFPQKLIGTTEPVALWLSTSGYTVGAPDGNVVELHPDRVRIPRDQSGRTTFVIRDGIKQAITPVDSSVSAGYGTAIDSTV